MKHWIKLLCLFLISMITSVAHAKDVAKIGTQGYASLEAAFAAAQDGDEITVLANSSGNGIKAPGGKFSTNGLTVDFGGFTYTVDGTTVGSTGTETQAFQLLKNNKITFKNGTITSEKAKILVQNYSDLTLQGMTLTLNNPNYSGAYTLSNNNGNTVIDGSTINANPAGAYAFDVCRYSSYPSVSVTVKGNSTINGSVEVSASGNDAKDGFSLTLESGSISGDLVIDPSADKAMEAAPEKVNITKNAAFTQTAPEGYSWDATTGELTPEEYAAQIGSNKYRTLSLAFADAADGQTITVLRNCSGNGIKVAQGKYTQGLTVDFDGHTYTMDGTMVGSTGTETQAFQLLKDNNITFKDGTITSTKALMLVQNYSNLTLEGMTLTLNNPNKNGAYTLSNNNGNVVIDGTTINANNTTDSYAFDVCRYASYPSVNVTVKGESVINGNVEVSASGNDAKDGFSLTLESGTLNGNIVLDATAKAAMAATPDKAEVTKKDTFSQDAPTGYKWVSNGDGTSSLQSSYVAQIGTTKYETLEAAFAAATDGQTITLLQDCAGNGIKVPQGKYSTGLTVDFNGHTYTMDGTMVGSTGTETQAFQLLKNNTITFKNGTIYSEKAKILVQNYSNLTLEGMTLTLNNSSYDGAYTLSNNNGNVVIDGSTINANPAGAFAFDVCRYASYPSVNVTVKGESVINGNVEVSASDSDAKDGFSLTLESGTLNGNIVLDATAQAAMASSPENTKVTKADSFNQAAAPQGYAWVSNGDNTSSLQSTSVAKIGDTKYDTLEAAFAAAQDGETITLLKDCAGNGIKVAQGKYATGLTVDFNGHTYTMDGTMVGSTGTETQAFQLLKNNTITFKNGTIYSEKAKILVQNYSNLTLEGMTLTLENPSYSSAYTLSNNNGNVVIDGSTITANPAGGFAFDVCRYSSYPSVSVTVTGTSVINGDVEVDAGSGDAKDGFSLTLESGTLTGNIVLTAGAQAAMAATPDKAEVTKANTFDQAAPTGYEWVDNGDGTSTLSVIYQAQIGETKYITFADAIAAVQDGETIELINDILPENQEITLPLTSGTITINGKYDFVNGTSGRKAFKYGKKTILRMKKGVQVKDMPGDPGFNYNLNSNERNNAQKLTILPEDFTNCKIVSSGMNSTGHTYTVEDREFLFAVGEQQYETWATALSAVSDGGTITMLKDHSTKTLSIDYSTGKAITLDMNGFSLKELTFWTGDVTVVNGTILEDCDLYPQEENSGKVSNLTIGANCTANNGIVLWPAFRAEVGYDANLTVLGTVNNGIFVHGTLHEGNSVINIEDGGKVLDDDGVAIAMNGHATVNVKDGATVTGGLTGIEVRAGNLNVSGGAITGGSGETSVDPNDSGSTTKNAGIAISQHTTKLPISVNVSYGEITATTALYIVNPQGNDDTAGAINVVISGDEEYPNFVGQTVIQDDRANLSISGGFFDTPVRAQDCAELYIPMIATGTRAGKYTVGIPYVAQITHDGVLTKYLSLAAACEAALEGDVVVMIDNSEETATSVVDKAITIDLNGKTVSRSNANRIINAFADLIITDNSEDGDGTLNGTNMCAVFIDNGATVTVNNGTVTGSMFGLYQNDGNTIINGGTVSSGVVTILQMKGDITLNDGNFVTGSDRATQFHGPGTFTINGGKITGEGCAIVHHSNASNAKIIINGGEINTKGLAIWPGGHGCELTINDGTITSTNDFAIAMNGSANFNGGTTVNIKGGTMNGGIYSPNQDAVLNITGGTITGGTGITMKGGTLNISDGTVTGTGDYKEPAAASSGATNTGAAIYVEDTYSAQGEGDFKPTVNITGGTFVSEHSYAVLFFTDKTTENYPYGGINIDYGVFVSPMADQTIKQVLPAGLDLKAIKIANGWYTEAIPAEYCVDGVEPDPNPRADAPDTRAQYTVLSTNEIILIDGEAYPYPGGIRAPKVTYRRTFSNSQVDKYQAWIVPMDYTLSDGDTQDFDFYKIHMIAASGDETGGLIDDNQPIYIYIEKLAAGRKISANLPYIVKPKSAGEFDFVVVNATLKADDHSRRLFMSTSEWNYEFYANYAEEMGATAANQWYAMSGGQICPNKNENAVLGSYRWYIKVTDNESNDPYYAPLAFVFEEGEATGISHNYIFDENELEGIYTVNGIKQETVTKGVNILKFKNGTTKKVYVK